MPANDIIKAWLVKAAHDLGYLLNLVGTKDDSFEGYYDKVDRVSRFAVQIRYPDQIIKLTREQTNEAIEMAELIFKIIQRKIDLS